MCNKVGVALWDDSMIIESASGNLLQMAQQLDNFNEILFLFHNIK